MEEKKGHGVTSCDPRRDVNHSKTVKARDGILTRKQLWWMETLQRQESLQRVIWWQLEKGVAKAPKMKTKISRQTFDLPNVY
jgi:hypothetical protein